MGKKCNRAILFSKIDEEKGNLISDISVTEQTLALSDEQTTYIDEKFVVRSLHEFEEKFDLKDIRCESIESVREETLHQVADYYTALIEGKKGKEYRSWYYGTQSQDISEHTKKQIPVKLYEVWLGVKSFFEQGEQIELLITNLSYEDLESEQVKKKLSLYLETVNEKQDQSRRIKYAILPEIPMLKEQDKITRVRFEGWKKETEREAVSQIASMIHLLRKKQVICCYQYVTGELSSAKAFAREGKKRIQENALELQEEINCDEISCCYPNLTWKVDQVYIGAAYVVTGVLLAGGGEKSETTLPRELYPYKEEIKREICKQPFGAMLAYEKQTGKRKMVLYSARSQKWSKGEYTRIDVEDMDV